MFPHFFVLLIFDCSRGEFPSTRVSKPRIFSPLAAAGGDEIFGLGPKMLAGVGSGSRGGSSHLSSPHGDLRGGRSFLFGNTWFMLSAYPARLLHTADRRAPAAAFVAAIHRTPRAVRAHGGTGQTLLQRGIIMAACGYAFGRAELGAAKRHLEKDLSVGNHTSRIVAMGSVGSAARPDVSFKYRGVDYYKKVGASLKCREQLGSSRTFWTSAVGPGRKLSFSVEPWARDFSTSCVAPYSAGATERQLTMDNSAVASDEYVS